MRVKIDRDTCGAHLAFCEQCLGKFLREPYGYERRCFVELEDDGKDEFKGMEKKEKKHLLVG